MHLKAGPFQVYCMPRLKEGTTLLQAQALQSDVHQGPVKTV